MTSTPKKSPVTIYLLSVDYFLRVRVWNGFVFSRVFILLRMYGCTFVHTWLHPREMNPCSLIFEIICCFSSISILIDFLKSVNIVIGDIMRGVILEKFSGCEFHLLVTRIRLNEITREWGEGENSST